MESKIKSWKVEGSHGDVWTVLYSPVTKEVSCDCPLFIYHRYECHHIKLVRLNKFFDKLTKGKPRCVLAKVLQPKYNERVNQLFIPLIPLPDKFAMELTIIYNMLKYGYSMGEIRELRYVPKHVIMANVIEHISIFGEAKYPDDWYKEF